MNKKWLSIMICSLFLGACQTNHEALKVLGDQPFSSDKWKAASQEDRATMVYSLVSSHDLKTMDYQQIVALLGEPTAYYDHDTTPAYWVGSKSVKHELGHGYLLVFPTDHKTGLVKRYFIEPKLP